MNGVIRRAACIAFWTPSTVKQFERMCSRHRYQFKDAPSTQPTQAGHAHRPFGRKFFRDFPAVDAQGAGSFLWNIRYGKAGERKRAHGAYCGAATTSHATLVELDCGLANSNRLDRAGDFTGTTGCVARCAQGQASVFKQNEGMILAQRFVFEIYGNVILVRRCLFHVSKP